MWNENYCWKYLNQKEEEKRIIDNIWKMISNFETIYYNRPTKIIINPMDYYRLIVELSETQTIYDPDNIQLFGLSFDVNSNIRENQFYIL